MTVMGHENERPRIRGIQMDNLKGLLDIKERVTANWGSVRVLT